MQSSIEIKFFSQGESIVDQKLKQLEGIEKSTSVQSNLYSPNKTKQDNTPDVIVAPRSIEALECIDEIHDSQQKKMNEGMPGLKTDLEYWTRANYLPVQMSTVINLASMDARRHKERLENQLTENDFFTSADALKDLEKIKRRFNIEIDEDHFNSDP